MDGRALRTTAPRSSHARWEPRSDRDPVGLLRGIFATLIPELVPVRIQRMSASPFAFYRGSAALMASDLATTPNTGITAQLSGDAHVANFGGYASPERRLVFDVNDFDETAQGPWEWDVKRLAASLVLAGRERKFAPKAIDAAARTALATYRDRTAEYATKSALDVWYAAIDVSLAVGTAMDARARRDWLREEREARHETALAAVPKLTEIAGTQRRFVEHPPVLEHVDDPTVTVAGAQKLLDAYRGTLRHDARLLLDRFTLVDVARKVVGVGSVGTWCLLLLLVDRDGAPFLLQAKEARASALEPYGGTAPYASPGERIVAGQRMTQAASDPLLGWAEIDGRSLYIRQYRDMKVAPDLTTLRPDELQDFAMHCGWALARAHARTGDPRAVAAYIGRSDRFVDAICAFARAYADQAEHDHAAFVAEVPHIASPGAAHGA
ncbi:MAG: DUF2252 domain-containing protein [Candidatus Eremiobacteraeota bacterium]|nr:DUF2252 domain-containing protein [Candidatus Eremiobacteraeota bacterium]